MAIDAVMTSVMTRTIVCCFLLGFAFGHVYGAAIASKATAERAASRKTLFLVRPLSNSALVMGDDSTLLLIRDAASRATQFQRCDPDLPESGCKAELLETCRPLDGVFRCVCPENVSRAPNGKCTVANECFEKSRNNCSINAQCIDLLESYTCKCLDGFRDLSPDPAQDPGRICTSDDDNDGDRSVTNIDKETTIDSSSTSSVSVSVSESSLSSFSKGALPPAVSVDSLDDGQSSQKSIGEMLDVGHSTADTGSANVDGVSSKPVTAESSSSSSSDAGHSVGIDVTSSIDNGHLSIDNLRLDENAKARGSQTEREINETSSSSELDISGDNSTSIEVMTSLPETTTVESDTTSASETTSAPEVTSAATTEGKHSKTTKFKKTTPPKSTPKTTKKTMTKTMTKTTTKTPSEIDQNQLIKQLLPNKNGNNKRNLDGDQLRLSSGDLKEVFQVFDVDGNDLISFFELKDAVEKYGLLLTDDDVHQMVRVADVSGEGLVDFSEFASLMKS